MANEQELQEALKKHTPHWTGIGNRSYIHCSACPSWNPTKDSAIWSHEMNWPAFTEHLAVIVAALAAPVEEEKETMSDEAKEFDIRCWYCEKPLENGVDCSHPEVTEEVSRATAILAHVDFYDHFCCGMPANLCKAVQLAKVLSLRERELREALECIQHMIQQLPSGIDYQADENDTSPEDAAAHIGGLIYRRTLAAIVALERKAP